MMRNLIESDSKRLHATSKIAMTMDEGVSSSGRQRWLWRTYAALAALRVVASVFFMGMVHPDEFFQSQEVMARHALAAAQPQLAQQLFVPWEFLPDAPNRSVLFPALVAGAPFQLLQWLHVPLSGLALLLTPRLLLCALSFTIDGILFAVTGKLLRRSNASNVRAQQIEKLVVFASAWPAWVLLARPFSNSFETLVLALCLAALHIVGPHRRVGFGLLHLQTLVLGALLAVGFFTRFTFAVFFLPIGVQLVFNQDTVRLEAHAKRDKSTPSLLRRVVAAFAIGVQGLLAFLVTATVMIAIDTVYFRPETLHQTWPEQVRKLVIAPLNNLVYNLQYDNLELHGVHPRITHIVVNMPMLFGPVAILFLVQVFRRREWRQHDVFGVVSALFPIVMLSLAPHQEPRFLLPAIVPLHIFTATQSLVQSRAAILLWIVFNAALGLFFGVLHQGGIVPLLLALSSGPSAWSVFAPACDFNTSTLAALPLPPADVALPLVFSKTYMPPRFLLAGVPPIAAFHVVDLGGKSVSELPRVLARESIESKAWTTMGPEASALLAFPGGIGADTLVEKSAFIKSWTRVGSCGPHISTEDFATPFTLELYHLSVSTAPLSDLMLHNSSE